ncbi:NAD(P)H-hydrate dehydratase [Altibacter sp.]|uniref:NAD(P)H-hydrate dehydratase n=1 Tax=Altibacter sp. TaxID=2024823 RepID=UPI000C91411A|nr:NAD(P)H-hydrate dehydratase [Altibacter sp.]MAP55999.1 bifunctional ADP-dependent NAD(P)H-hydrate dehydratase/NAD(P)H-hydrate epimerase [Altibacter sp.]
MKIFSSEQLYHADKITTEKEGITSVDLMERAGTQIFNWLHQRMQGAQVPIHIFCGIGNNGGDGLVVGRLLIEHGYNVNLYVVNCSDKRSKEFLINYDRVKNVTKNWPKLMKSEDDFPAIAPQDIIIDAIFGIGLNRCPDGWVKKLIQYLNANKAFKLSIDIPSGLFAEKPVSDPDAVLKANHTLTFQVPKLSFFLPDTGIYVPFYEAIDIGLDAEFLSSAEPLAQLIGKQEAQLFYKQRQKYDHKGTYGHALVVAGSYGKMGAAVLATKAALRTGAGMATTFTAKCGYSILQTAIPEAMVLTDEHEEFLTAIDYNFQPSAIGIGMGIGVQEETVSAFKTFLMKTEVPVLLDADALNILSSHKEILDHIPKHSILTPHPGELERLIGSWSSDYDKLDKAKAFAKEYDLVLLIKGANSIVVFEEKLYINTTGNPGMATAGSGDVLSGMITGLLSQGYDPLLATVFAVYLHGSAGNIASQELGYEAVIAGDIIEKIGNAYLSLFEQEPPETEQA